ncbi:MAG: hypothetical protein J6K41_02325 [Paraprevotella sp.]|nr:hypothetical protein [Paraprevotella sp.]
MTVLNESAFPQGLNFRHSSTFFTKQAISVPKSIPVHLPWLLDVQIHYYRKRSDKRKGVAELMRHVEAEFLQNAFRMP